MATKKAAAKTAETRDAPTFSKEALMKADVFTGRTDALGAVVRDGESLTIEEAKGRINKFMKGTVE